MILNKPQMIYISEPKLSFAMGQKLEDPRDGLMLFGPYTKNKHYNSLIIGIIGPTLQRNYLKKYLMKIQTPIKSICPDIARPFFPGLGAAYDISIKYDMIQEIDVSINDINKFLKYSDSSQRVYHLTELYAKPLIKYSNEEHTFVSIWFVVIPEIIYLLGRPKSAIAKTDDAKNIGLSKKIRSKNTEFLFDDWNEVNEAYKFEVHFHNQLKAKLLNDKIVTQIIRDEKIAYESLWKDSQKILTESIFDSSKAWNISTALYYKSGGIPWKLGDVRKNVCYLGIVFKKNNLDPKQRNACCAAQMFLDSGDGMVFRGNIGPWYNPETKQFHINRYDAHELLNLSLESFKNKSESKMYPEMVFIHAKTYFDDEEWSGFCEAAEGKSQIVGIKIRDNSEFKLYRNYSYCIPRGSALIIDENCAFLWTKGFVPRLQTQFGLETPNPLSIEIARGKEDITVVCKDIMALTKLNYNSCIFADGLPVTLRFAESIGEILTAGENLKNDILPFKHYI